MSLHLHSIRSPEDRQSWLESFDSRKQTYVVADLRSKYEIQKTLFSKTGVLEEFAVLRAAELWQKSVGRLKPEISLISHQLSTSLLSHWLKDYNIPWAHTPGIVSLVQGYMAQFLPILCDPQGKLLLHEWWQENPEALTNWGQWYFLCEKLWQRFSEEGLLPSNMASGLLSDESDLGSHWSRELVVDLGVDMSVVEAGVLQLMAQTCDVHVLVPEPDWATAYNSQYMAYQLLQGKSYFQSEAELSEERALPKFTVESLPRYSTMITEVKALVSQIRDWLEQGVAANQIAIVVPDLESYWPSLHMYLQQEGIPFDKPIVESLQSIPQVNTWLAELRIRAKQLDSTSLEQVLYGSEEAPLIDYDRYAQLFKLVFELEDLSRDPRVAEHFKSRKDPDSLMSRDEFLAWAIRFWRRDDNSELIERIFSSLMQECSAGLSLPLLSWVFYIENAVAKTEIAVGEGTSLGITVIGLEAYPFINSSHVWIVGATEAHLVESQSTALNLQDIRSLSQSTGFNLSVPDQYHKEFLLMWGLQRAGQQVTLSFPSTDFEGGVQTPSRIWLQACLQYDLDTEELKSPGSTRWDELQQSSLSHIAEVRDWSESHMQMLEQRLGLDLAASTEALQPLPAMRLSVSSLEDYVKCPFVMTAKRLFRLSDLPSLDLDVDRMTNGKFVHAVLEEVLKDGRPPNLSDDEIDSILEKCRVSEKIFLADFSVWEHYKTKQRDLVKRFLQFETEWRQQWPKTQTVARELKIKFSWDQAESKFVAPDQGQWPFVGYIDRVDSNSSGDQVVIDYKSSTASMSNYKAWAEKGEFQLAVYSQAMQVAEHELSSGENGTNVVGAFYFDLRAMERKKGFGILDEDHQLFATYKKGAALAPREGIEEAQQKVMESVAGVIDSISAGRLGPSPKKIETCYSCSWRSLCRAPHLN